MLTRSRPLALKITIPMGMHLRNWEIRQGRYLLTGNAEYVGSPVGRSPGHVLYIISSILYENLTSEYTYSRIKSEPDESI